MLRYPPEAALQSVGADAVEPPVGDGVDVEVPDLAEWYAALPEPPQREGALGAGRHDRQRHTGGHWPGIRHRGPGGNEDDPDKEHGCRDRVHLQAGAFVVEWRQRRRRRSGDRGRKEEIAPVVVDWPVGEIRIARRRTEL